MFLHTTSEIVPVAVDLTLSAARGGGRQNLPMARKFNNSSNSEEFVTLALLDILPFVITKP